MADTYDKVKEFQEAYSIKDRLSVLAEYVWMFEPFDKGGKNRMLIVAELSQCGNTDANEWQGKVEQIRRSIVT